MLAVVQKQHQTAGAQVAGQRCLERNAGLLFHAQKLRNNLRYQPGRGDRSQVNQPHSVLEAAHLAPGYLECQPRLSASTSSGQGNQPGSTKTLLDGGELTLASNKTRQLKGQIVQPISATCL